MFNAHCNASTLFLIVEAQSQREGGDGAGGWVEGGAGFDVEAIVAEGEHELVAAGEQELATAAELLEPDREVRDMADMLRLHAAAVRSNFCR
jgi:hypothetical protein